MKFNILIALVAATTAIRVSKESHPDPQTLAVAESLATPSLLLGRGCKDWIEWLEEEAGSDDGLTWPELLSKLEEMATKRGKTLSEKKI